MERSDLYEGQAVFARMKINGKRRGVWGTVLRVPNSTNIPVEFCIRIDEGHSCKGRGQSGYCFYVSPEYLYDHRWEPDSECDCTSKNEAPKKARKEVMASRLSAIVRKFVDKDLRVLMQIGWIDSCLEPTQEGLDYMLEKLFLDNKVELAKDARAQMKEEKAAKKGEEVEDEA